MQSYRGASLTFSII